jgi:hypothetical protein
MSGMLPAPWPPSKAVFEQGRRYNDIGRALSMAAFVYRPGANCVRETRATCPLAVNLRQLAGLRAVTIHAAPSIITDRSPGQPVKTARTAAEARARISSV